MTGAAVPLERAGLDNDNLRRRQFDVWELIKTSRLCSSGHDKQEPRFAHSSNLQSEVDSEKKYCGAATIPSETSSLE